MASAAVPSRGGGSVVVVDSLLTKTQTPSFNVPVTKNQSEKLYPNWIAATHKLDSLKDDFDIDLMPKLKR